MSNLKLNIENTKDSKDIKEIKDSMNDIKVAGDIYKNTSLAKYNTWHVGGNAELVFKPRDLSDLQDFMQQLYQIDKSIDITWLGLGSNVLIRDAGLPGVVIITNNGKDKGLNNLELLNTQEFGEIVSVGAGVPCAKLAKYLVDNRFSNAAFWAGIPGTMGGALAMNAGCYGSETWEFVTKVQVINRKGELQELTPQDFTIKYRSACYNSSETLGDELWFVNAWLKLPKAQDKEYCGRTEIKELLAKRSSSQPIGQFSGGSVFKNPKGDYSARLIEAAGLKGYKIGGAQVSTKHANFIINDKTATASNIEQLIYHLQQVVHEKFNIKLEPEVKIIGLENE